jgi:SPP1 gp7 family putative phage head morphogenesis protein
MAHIKPGIDVKLELLNKSPFLITRVLQDMTRQLVEGNTEGVFDATDHLARLMGQTMALADVIGRYRTILESDVVRQRKGSHGGAFRFMSERFSVIRFGSETPIFPETAFHEAFEDLLSRDARLANSAAQIRKVYATHGFALRGFPLETSVKAREYLTKEIQKEMARLGAAGVPANEAKKRIAEKAPFTEAYAQTAYRTNLATCMTAGRFQQLKDPEVRAVAPAFMFDAVTDDSVRDNHLAAKGLIADVNHSVWHLFSPPLGFNCRCDLNVMDIFELKDRGLLKRNGEVKTVYPSSFREAHPDRGFKVARPDHKVYK